jgi:fucose permease
LRNSSIGTSVLHMTSVRRDRFGTLLTFFLTGAIFGTFAARIPAIKQDLALGDSQLAIAFAGLNLGALVGLQFGGPVLSRLGSRTVLRVALPLFAGGLALLALATNLPLLTAILFLSAATNSVVDVGSNAHGIALERRMRRPMLSGLHAMHPLGGIIAAALGAVAAGLAIDTARHFLLAAVITGVLAILATALLVPAASDVDGPHKPDIGVETALTMWVRGWSPRVLALGSLAFTITLGKGAALDWSAVYLEDTLAVGPGVAAVGVAVFLGGITLGRLVADGLIVRYGPVTMFRGGCLIAGASLGAALFFKTLIAGLAGLALFGLGISYLFPLIFSTAAVDATTTASTGDVVARISTLAYFGSFVGPALIGGLAGSFGLSGALMLPALLITGTAFAANVLSQSSSLDVNSSRQVPGQRPRGG